MKFISCIKRLCDILSCMLFLFFLCITAGATMPAVPMETAVSSTASTSNIPSTSMVIYQVLHFAYIVCMHQLFVVRAILCVYYHVCVR